MQLFLDCVCATAISMTRHGNQLHSYQRLSNGILQRVSGSCPESKASLNVNSAALTITSDSGVDLCSLTTSLHTDYARAVGNVDRRSNTPITEYCDQAETTFVVINDSVATRLRFGERRLALCFALTHHHARAKAFASVCIRRDRSADSWVNVPVAAKDQLLSTAEEQHAQRIYSTSSGPDLPSYDILHQPRQLHGNLMPS